MVVNRRSFIASLSLLPAAMAAAAERQMPANKNVKWALSSALWNYFPAVPFTDILDVMKDTGFIGLRVTSFPQILDKFGMTQAQMVREVTKRGLHVVTISWNGPLEAASKRQQALDSAKAAMKFLAEFGANHLVVFSPNREKPGANTPAGFEALCACCNQIGELAGGMGFTAGLHNHMGQMVQTREEIDRFMAMTDPKLFGFSPDTAHLDLAGCDVVGTIERYKERIRFLDYKDARWTMPAGDWVHPNGKVLAKDSTTAKFFSSIYDLGDGEVDFSGCHRVLKSVNYRGWICVDLDTARKGPRADYERCGTYVVEKLEPIFL
ncbi:MAG TPA: sugar phosphate isomerase/epimerase [Acidobacteriaceae bacterium]